MKTPLLFLVCALGFAQSWTVRVEEPTGLYPRDREVVAVSLPASKAFTVVDAAGRELPWQYAAGKLLFPASLIPGELPEYRIAATNGTTREFAGNPIHLRKIGLRRVEVGNAFFRAVIDLDAAAIVEAYHLRTESPRRVNLVETTPESKQALKGDIHESNPPPPPPMVPGVDGENTGWTSLGGTGAFEQIEFLETGPLRGHLRLTRKGETWDIVFTASLPGFRWKAATGFRLASISASPYVPFNRCLDGSEYSWPTGPGEDEPKPNEIAPRDSWKKLPGGHIVYYQREENYGALGLVALDPGLSWTGAGSRRVVAREATGAPTEIAVLFPSWKGAETVLEARKEYRILKQPLLTRITATSTPVEVKVPLARVEPLQRGSGAATPFQADTVSLDGAWELAWAEKGEGPPTSGWKQVTVPGTAHVQWLGNDPTKIYSRDAEWISSKEWWYRRSFDVPARFATAKRVRLQFDATDYHAEVFVNGAYVGRHEGYIDPHEYDVTLKPGARNEIQVRVWTPVHYYWKHRPYTIKGSYGGVDQKPDDITALGITRSVRLVASTEAVIQNVAVNTRLISNNNAEVEVDLHEPPSGHEWELTLTPRNFAGSERFQVRSATSRIVIPVPNAKLWWTWDHGKPNLYTLSVRLIEAASGTAVDGRDVAVGIREIDKIGWNFYLNRKKLFIRGTNYYFHLYMSEMDRAKYARDVDLMLGMNVNMIRVHCHYSNPEFYDLADEKGILLWQDFLEAWYPHDRRFAQHAAPLYDNHIRYVRNHPSVALWATSDEEDFENYTEITKHLAARPYFLDPQHRPVIRSTGRFGDSHVYHGWYDGSIWDYTQMTETFVSELGATGLPNYETLQTFLGSKWPIEKYRDDWVWRRLQINEAFRAWGDPAGLTMEQYIPKTQAYVARLFQLAIERMRRRKAEGAGGILHFHAIDIWPSVTMAAIDFARKPTKTWDTVRRSFEPVAALFEYDHATWKRGEDFTCALWAANDNWDGVPGATLWWTLTNNGRHLLSGSRTLSLAADSSVKVDTVRWKIPADAVSGAYELRAGIKDAQGKTISENIYEFELNQ